MHLDAHSCGIYDDGAIAFAELISTNSSLMILSLRANYIADKGALALAEAIPKNSGKRQRNATSYSTFNLHLLRRQGSCALAARAAKSPKGAVCLCDHVYCGCANRTRPRLFCCEREFVDLLCGYR